MYTKYELEKYSEMLRKSGLTSDEAQEKQVLDFVYRLSAVAADMILCNYHHDGQVKKNTKAGSRPDQR